MAELPTTLEIERLMNLIRNFGWTKKAEMIEGNKLIITLEKPIEVKPVPTPT